MLLEENINIAKSFLGNQFFDDLLIESKQDESIIGLKVVREGKKVTISYKRKCDFFRALTLIKENIKNTSFDIRLENRFNTNGLMLDCSRNGVPKLSLVKEIILTQALMGQNRLLMYTEDTYEMKKYPYFGYLRGAYSEEELKEMVAFGEDFGVELVPCIQTLDHLERPLRWRPFENIRDSASNLFVGKEETYEFIEEMLKVSRNIFHSKDIHIGMDESFNMGLGRYLLQNGFKDRVELFCKHLKRVIDLCKKFDFTPMIWSDMFFRLNDKDGEYYSGNKLPQSTLDLIPEGVNLVYWDYYHEEKEIYDRMMSSHKETKRETIFGGGSWRWSGFAPALHKSYLFSNSALKSCVKNNVKDVFITAWGDNGNECSFHTSYLVMAQYATFDYYGEALDDKVNSLLFAVTGETKERMLLLDLPNMPDNKVLCAPYNPSKYFFYQDPLLGIFDGQAKPQFAINYNLHYETLLKASRESERFSIVYLNLANLCRVLNQKVDLGIRLRKSYKANDKKSLSTLANDVIPSLLKDIDVFHSSLETQWNLENKRFGFEVLDGRIGFLKERLESTKKIVNNYLEGKIPNIEELEKEILPYDGLDYEICWNQWSTNVSPTGI